MGIYLYHQEGNRKEKEMTRKEMIKGIVSKQIENGIITADQAGFITKKMMGEKKSVSAWEHTYKAYFPEYDGIYR